MRWTIREVLWSCWSVDGVMMRLGPLMVQWGICHPLFEDAMWKMRALDEAIGKLWPLHDLMENFWPRPYILFKRITVKCCPHILFLDHRGYTIVAVLRNFVPALVEDNREQQWRSYELKIWTFLELGYLSIFFQYLNLIIWLLGGPDGITFWRFYHTKMIEMMNERWVRGTTLSWRSCYPAGVQVAKGI